MRDRTYIQLIGIPYEEMNCWDLVVRFYKEYLNIELRHYCDGTPSNRDSIQNLIYANVGEFEEVKGPKKLGDIILFKVRGIISHIGVLIDNSYFLHSIKGTGSALERINKWEKLVVGYYRIESRDKND